MQRARLILLPFSLLYGLGVAVRNLFFDIGIFKTTAAGVPVISIGNLSAGGTGKTPIVEMLALRLRNAGKKVAVVSRGYRRQSTGYVLVSNGSGPLTDVQKAGDEALQMAGNLDGVIVAVDESRVRAARTVARTLGADRIILDDGFQHRDLHRDLNIVVVTASEILAGEFLLPAGNRREPLRALKRSDIVIVTRWKDREEFERAAQKVKQFGKPVAGARIELCSFRTMSANQPVELSALSGKRVVAFSGIGNPDSFEELLASSGAVIEQHLVFPDHHWFTAADLKNISDARERSNAVFIVTTEKDAARMNAEAGEFSESTPVVVVRIRQNVTVGGELLNDLLKRLES